MYDKNGNWDYSAEADRQLFSKNSIVSQDTKNNVKETFGCFGVLGLMLLVLALVFGCAYGCLYCGASAVSSGMKK